MNPKTVQSVSQEIYRRFPDLDGRAPHVKACPSGSVRSGLRLLRRQNTFLLVYRARKTTSTGKNLPFAVRVIADQGGKILKISLTH